MLRLASALAALVAAAVAELPGRQGKEALPWHRGRPSAAALAPSAAAEAAPCAPGMLLSNGRPSFRDPGVWGPPTWFFLHSVTLALPERVPPEQQREFSSLMLAMQKLLPCPGCSKHLVGHMREHPLEPHLGTRDGLVQWMIDIHNMVNRDIGKPELTKEEVLRLYLDAYDGRSPAGHEAVLDRGAAARLAPASCPAALAAIAAFAALGALGPRP
mmetsp:Transcript_3158/g.9441  ORF Transcript_3158/g.9441 Transcript_3158/m.9441 type:complete len:215 (-) Transcript_3158:194-838(-)